MDEDPDVTEIAGALRVSIGLLLRRLRQVHVEGELTLPESSALTRLDRGGPATSSALAKLEQISPQSMGTTLAALEARGLVGGIPTRPTAGGWCCRSPTPGRRSSRTSATRGPSSWPGPCPPAFTPRGAQPAQGGRTAARPAGESI